MAVVRAFITGEAGFLGRHFTAELGARGWHVAGCDANPRPGRIAESALTQFQTNARRYDLVVHCAAVAPHRAAIDGLSMHLARNLHLDAAMFAWAARTKQHRVLYVSSSAAYPVSLQCQCEPRVRLGEAHAGQGDPDAGYGWTKLTGERLAAEARRAGVPVTVVRPFSGYGEDQGENWPFGAFIARARRREDPFHIWGDGSQVRDWIHVSDVVNGALAVVESGTEEPVNLCTGVGTSMLDLVELMCNQAGYSPQIELRVDKPSGVAYRVGDPTRMNQHYTAQVDIDEGVRRALA